MLWRDLSRLARTAVIVTAFALLLAGLMVIGAAVGNWQASFAGFIYSMFLAFAALCLWLLVGVRRGVVVCLGRRR